MYKCDCDDDGNFSHNYFNLRETVVDSEGICQRCHCYAKWCNEEETRASNNSLKDVKLTVFRLNTNERKHFNNSYEASEWAGFSVKSAIGRFVKEGRLPYHGTTKNIVIVEGHVDNIPENIIKEKLGITYYAFDYDSGELLAEGTAKALVKKTKDTLNSIHNNISRNSIKSTNNIVYSKNRDFDLEGYKRAMELPSDFDAPKWRQDVIDFDDSELGVAAEVDYYGTWKEKLYS